MQRFRSVANRTRFKPIPAVRELLSCKVFEALTYDRFAVFTRIQIEQVVVDVRFVSLPKTGTASVFAGDGTAFIEDNVSFTSVRAS